MTNRPVRSRSVTVASLFVGAAGCTAAVALLYKVPAPPVVPTAPLDERLLDTAAHFGRWVVIGVAAYLALLCALQVLAAFSSRRGVRRLAHIATPRVLGALTAGLLVTSTTVGAAGATGGGPTHPDSSPPTLRRVERTELTTTVPAPSSTTTTAAATASTIESQPESTTTAPPATSQDVAATAGRTMLPWAQDPHSARLRPQEPPQVDPPSGLVTPLGTAATGAGAGAGTLAEAPSPSTASTYVVQRGDHFWSIAEAEVARRSGAGPYEADPPTEAVAAYWKELVDANRHRLIDPSNPDLIHPGLEIALPR